MKIELKIESVVLTESDGDYVEYDVLAQGHISDFPQITVIQDGVQIWTWDFLPFQDRQNILGYLAEYFDFHKPEEFDAPERFATVNELNAQNGWLP